jgi:peptidoglycan/xylan/chitin deacetylase (PgdA/CDA1 family)
MSQTVTPLHLAGAWDVYPGGGFKWRVRALLKQALYLAYLWCGWIFVRDLVLSWLGRSRIVILYYHRVGWVDVLSKPTGEFRKEVAYLARHFECLTMRQLAERLKAGTPIWRKVAVITFDDGYRDNFLSALPELKRAGVPATLFVATGYIGTQRKFPHDTRAVEEGRSIRDDWDKLTWEDLRAMQEAGIEIGSHTVEHANLGRTDREGVRKELRDSLGQLQQKLGAQPRAFSFPWGKRQDMSEEAVAEVRDAGYYCAVTTLSGMMDPDDDLFRIRRIDVGNGHYSRWGILALMEGFGCGWLARHLRGVPTE